MKFKTFKRIIASLAFMAGALSVVGCNGGSQGEGGGEGQKKIDYAHNGACKLSLSYLNHDFFQDGVGEFELHTHIDGDTAHFEPVVQTTSGEIVKARFYGIDTPESTGRVQPYGKEASDFTKEKLNNAKKNGTIVLAGVSNAYGKASTDANGRYLVCVWINETTKKADPGTLVNLNLWVLQEGLSELGDVTKMPEYEETFKAAYFQAQDLKLNKFSGKPAAKFNYGDYEDCYIPDIMREVYKNLADPTYKNPYDGKNVRITGTVAGFANNTMYLQKLDYDDPETEEVEGDGKVYGINIYCGPTGASIAIEYRTPGAVLELYGIAQDSETFGFQITGAEGRFLDMPEFAGDSDVKILVKAEDNSAPDTALVTKNYTIAELNKAVEDDDTDPIFAPVTVEGELTVDYYSDNASRNTAGEVTKAATAWTIGFKESKFDIYLTSAYTDAAHPRDPYTDEDHWYTDAQHKNGKKFVLHGGVYAYHRVKRNDGTYKTYYQIVLTNKADLELVTE